MFVRTAFFFLLLNLTGVMLFKLKKNDEIEIPENRKRPNVGIATHSMDCYACAENACHFQALECLDVVPAEYQACLEEACGAELVKCWIACFSPLSGRQTLI
ncbi:uncharacterized protein LOC110064736 [Orbicella faveolata]|uniref:uncharacterized protein LOC110064736 n=1 Tax=Orbicella faveolata TaxID=48498 RepID=UPI0009E42755|nr:uncharacterized protein LOC110064736 [Orbicella faveolata]